VISGGGGQKLYPVEEGQPDTVFAASRAGFAKLDFSGDQLKLAYYDEQGGAATHFTWARGCPWMAKGCLIADNRQ
jgi:tartrate-resistant acid phosphatase type 5